MIFSRKVLYFYSEVYWFGFPQKQPPNQGFKCKQFNEKYKKYREQWYEEEKEPINGMLINQLPHR